MKKILVLGLLLMTSTSFAETRELLCQAVPNRSQGAFAISLDNSGWDPKSSFFQITQAFWMFQYSTASMICSDDALNISRKESFRCTGYNSAGGMTEVSVELENGEGNARVHSFGEGAAHNIYGGQIEGMVLPCRLKM